jgi:hypothetical protein
MSLMIADWGSGAFGGNFIFFPDTVKRFLVGGLQLSGDLGVFLWAGIILYLGALVLAAKVGGIFRHLTFVTQHKVVD